jgi:hypothetical protein
MRTHRTEKQIEASRLNGAKSRGSVAPQGLANCAGNHLYAQLSPQGYCEQILVEKMASPNGVSCASGHTNAPPSSARPSSNANPPASKTLPKSTPTALATAHETKKAA